MSKQLNVIKDDSNEILNDLLGNRKIQLKEMTKSMQIWEMNEVMTVIFKKIRAEIKMSLKN